MRQHHDAGRFARRDWTVAAGVVLLVAAVYFLSGPGRIDMFDGQWRYEVAARLLAEGRPALTSKFMTSLGVSGLHGLRYAPYSVGASAAALPLVALGFLLDRENAELHRFLFAFTSGAYGALLAGLLYAFHLALGVERRRAVAWALVSAFASLVWPTAVSTFDNVQHAFFALLALYGAHQSLARGADRWALGGGLAAGALISYQEPFLAFVPFLALAALGPLGAAPERRRALRRVLLFGLAALSGVLVTLAYNHVRFGSPFYSGKVDVERTGHPSILGNPLVGLPSLLFSPGKSVLLYSPTLLLGLLGIRALWRRAPRLGLAVVVTSTWHLLFIASLTFFGGDWCWGPRYLVVLLPMWSLAFPWVSPTALRPRLKAAIVGIAALIQVMGVSVDHIRFFTELRLPDFFWAEQPTIYWRESGLLARSREVAATVRDGVPREATQFVPSFDPPSVTTCPIRTWTPALGPVLMRQYKVYYLPRPWPFWVPEVAAWQRPVRPLPWVTGTVLAGLAGLALIVVGLKRGRGEAVPDN